MSNENPAAFPELKELRTEEGRTVIYHATSIGGMSLRDYFAATVDAPMALVNLSLHTAYPSNNGVFKLEEIFEARAKLRFMEADAMLAARSQPDRPCNG